ncbi:hypothetical protein EDB89DRAFT_1913379 [Lactarius sanguifluus]|nr:hypothetical protein EDB89DRAFT_1913379 [Lactarius sanguifluus]
MQKHAQLLATTLNPVALCSPLFPTLLHLWLKLVPTGIAPLPVGNDAGRTWAYSKPTAASLPLAVVTSQTPYMMVFSRRQHCLTLLGLHHAVTGTVVELVVVETMCCLVSSSSAWVTQLDWGQLVHGPKSTYQPQALSCQLKSANNASPLASAPNHVTLCPLDHYNNDDISTCKATSNGRKPTNCPTQQQRQQQLKMTQQTTVVAQQQQGAGITVFFATVPPTLNATESMQKWLQLVGERDTITATTTACCCAGPQPQLEVQLFVVVVQLGSSFFLVWVTGPDITTIGRGLHTTSHTLQRPAQLQAMLHTPPPILLHLVPRSSTLPFPCIP